MHIATSVPWGTASGKATLGEERVGGYDYVCRKHNNAGRLSPKQRLDVRHDDVDQHRHRHGHADCRVPAPVEVIVVARQHAHVL